MWTSKPPSAFHSHHLTAYRWRCYGCNLAVVIVFVCGREREGDNSFTLGLQPPTGSFQPTEENVRTEENSFVRPGHKKSVNAILKVNSY